MFNMLQSNTGSGIDEDMLKGLQLRNLMQTSPATNQMTIDMARLAPMTTQANINNLVLDARKKGVDLSNLIQTSPATNKSTIAMAGLAPITAQANIDKTRTETSLMPKQTDIKLIDVLNKNVTNRIAQAKLPYDIFNLTYSRLPEAEKAQYAIDHPTEFAQMQKDVIAQASSAGRPGYISPTSLQGGQNSLYGSQIQSILDKYLPAGAQQSQGNPQTPIMQQPVIQQPGSGGMASTPVPSQSPVNPTPSVNVPFTQPVGSVIPPENTPDIQKAAQNIVDTNTDIKLNKTLTSSQKQKLPYWRNLENTASVLESQAPAAAKFAGNPLAQGANWLLSSVNKQSPDYDNYKAYMANVDQFASQLRQSYGDSVQPGLRESFLKLVSPARFGENPQLFMQRVKMAMNIIRNEGLTASQPLHQLVSPQAQAQQNQNIVAGAQQARIQQPDTSARVRMISPSGGSVLMAQKDVNEALKSGFKMRQ